VTIVGLSDDLAQIIYCKCFAKCKIAVCQAHKSIEIRHACAVNAGNESTAATMAIQYPRIRISYHLPEALMP
jgi:hypothetical protein